MSQRDVLGEWLAGTTRYYKSMAELEAGEPRDLVAAGWSLEIRPVEFPDGPRLECRRVPLKAKK